MAETQYVTRSTPITVGDVWTAQIHQGSASVPTLRVPDGATKLKQIIYSFGDSAPTAAIIAHNFLLKLTGAVKDTDRQEFLLEGYTAFYATAGMTGGPGPQILRNVDVDVEQGELQMYVMATLGALGGAPEPTITLGFE